MDRKNAQEIINETGMLSYGSSYSGRGVSYNDLTSDMLDQMYSSVREERGDDAACNFFQMFSSLGRLTADNFITHLYRLEVCDWKWETHLLDERGREPCRDDGERATQDMAIEGFLDNYLRQ